MRPGLIDIISRFYGLFTEEHFAVMLASVTIIILAILIVFLAVRMNMLLFKRIIKRNDLHLKFAYSLINFLFVIGGIVLIGIFFGHARDLGRILLGSTGLLIAIIGFAAQSAIGDVIAGLMIGISKPYKLGDKITLESSGVSGTVRDMTVRHTVIHRFDGLYVIVPNSVINKEIVHNYSYEKELTGAYLEFNISYDSDIRTAMKIIHNAVIGSRYTVEYAGDNPEGQRAAVYMTGFGDSSISLRTTVWARNADESFLALSDIRMRVKDDFDKYGIEIPYNYLNVVRREFVSSEVTHAFESKNVYEDDMSEINRSVQTFCKSYKIEEKERMRLNLLAEELINLMSDYMSGESYFNIILNDSVCELHLKVRASISEKDKMNLLAISTIEDENRITSIIRRIMKDYTSGGIQGDQWSLKQYKEDVKRGDISAEDISKSILTTLSDDIKIRIRGDIAEIVVYKGIKLPEA